VDPETEISRETCPAQTIGPVIASADWDNMLALAKDIAGLLPQLGCVGVDSERHAKRIGLLATVACPILEGCRHCDFDIREIVRVYPEFAAAATKVNELRRLVAQKLARTRIEDATVVLLFLHSQLSLFVNMITKR